AWTVGFALPLIAAAAGDKPLGQWHDFAAVAIWLIGWAGETLADRQLAAFKAEADQGGEKTKVCRRGFWRYTRHPNYFFEWLQWWCWPLLALGSSTVWVALAGPIVMYLFLTRVTGIPPTEQQALRSRGDAYRQYQQETNAFFPGPPSTTTDT
ncbi:MAG: DUF1295 domain-containing protein, partial [Phycisphaeraceae bacterium]|nr:DUF1295 domain-containing protein [Phycisphaeraceae bacterium]